MCLSKSNEYSKIQYINFTTATSYLEIHLSFCPENRRRARPDQNGIKSMTPQKQGNIS